MPSGAIILTVQEQNNTPVLWEMGNPDNIHDNRVIEIFGTGNQIPNPTALRKYIGTFQINSGNFVGHTFERLS